MRIAVIGATGNAGTALLRRLQGAPEVTEIIGIARRAPDASREPYHGVVWREVDIAREQSSTQLAAILTGLDAVVHLAWILQPNHDLDALHRVNVTGTQHVLDAVARARVPQIVCASSIGAYSSAPKNQFTDEQWPTGGVHTSHYSRHKALNERAMDRFEKKHPEITVSRVRPGLIFQSGAGSEIGRYFLGPLVPKGVLRSLRPPILPVPSELVFQAVHADDAAEAYWQILRRKAAGAFNIAADPVLGPNELAWILGATRYVSIPLALLRAGADVTWRLHLQRSDAGWIDMASQAPIMSTVRARTVLGWNPEKTSVESVAEVVDGLGRGDGISGSPPLAPRAHQ